MTSEGYQPGKRCFFCAFLQNTNTNGIGKYLPDFKLYLFGSRADDTKKGGDIDILILSNYPLSRKDKRSIKIAFYNKFGEQKVDLVHFTYDDPAPFKELALMEAVPL